MGNKGGKEDKGDKGNKDKSFASNGGGEGGLKKIKEKGVIFKKILESDDVAARRELKAALKARSEPLDHALDFLEACTKRINVFVSGQRLGDDIEKGKDTLVGNGKTILERYVADSAEKSLKSLTTETKRKKVINGDLSEKEIFDEIVKEVEDKLQDLIDSA